MSLIIELTEKRVKAWNEAKAFLEKSRSEDGIVSAEDTETYEKMVAVVENLGNEVERLKKQAELDQILSQPTRNVLTSNPQSIIPKEKEGRASNEYRDAFWESMRTKNSYNVQNTLRIGEDTEGGYLVPDEYDRMLIEALEDENIFRQIADIIKTSSGDRKFAMVTSKGKAFWVDEGQQIPDSDDKFGPISIGAHKMATMIKVSDELLQDNVFNLEGYIIKEFARRMGTCEEEAFIIGDGKGMPVGILSDDGGAEVGALSTNPDSITADDVINLLYSLRQSYRAKAVFITNDTTIREIRKLKDLTGQYIWQPSIVAGEPDMILNVPVKTSSYIPELSQAGAKVMAVGDFSYYTIADRQSRAFQRLNELYAANGLVGFRATQRVDGRLRLQEAVKVLKLNNSTATTVATVAKASTTKK